MSVELQNTAVFTRRTVTRKKQTITAAHGSSGEALRFEMPTSRIKATNNHPQRALFYRIDGAGDWVEMPPGKAANLRVNLATQTVNFRRSEFAPASVIVDLLLYGIPSGLFTEENDSYLSASGALLVVGDSIALGHGLGSASSRFSSLVAAGAGLTETNVAISGSTVERYVEEQIAGRVLSSGDQVLFTAGFNNARYSGTSAAALTQYSNDLAGALCFLGTTDLQKKYTQIPGSGLNTTKLTFSGGGWTESPTWLGGLPASRAGAYSNVSGDYVEGTVDGDVAHVMIGGYAAFASSGFVTVDGVRVGTAGSIGPQPGAMADGGADAWHPVCIRLANLGPGSHTVRFTLSASQPLLVGYIAGYDSALWDRPTVYVVSPIRMTSAGYAEAPANATDAVMRLYQVETARVCAMLASEGLLVRYVDVDVGWMPSAAGVHADNVHPLEMWHAQAARSILREMERPMMSLLLNA